MSLSFSDKYPVKLLDHMVVSDKYPVKLLDHMVVLFDSSGADKSLEFLWWSSVTLAFIAERKRTGFFFLCVSASSQSSAAQNNPKSVVCFGVSYSECLQHLVSPQLNCGKDNNNMLSISCGSI